MHDQSIKAMPYPNTLGSGLATQRDTLTNVQDGTLKALGEIHQFLYDLESRLGCLCNRIEKEPAPVPANTLGKAMETRSAAMHAADRLRDILQFI